MDSEKDCPYCGERIKASAIKCKHCGSMLVSGETGNPELQHPDTWVRHALNDKYEILGVLGKGGMATVYRAIQKNLGREVAVKVIHQNLVHDTEFIRRFTREATVSASLSHPNIVTIHDVGSVGAVHYLTMELLQGVTLNDYLKQQKKLSAEEVIELFVPLAKALAYIHNKNLVHRDLKSSNIFLAEEGRPVLTDFGIVYAGNETKLSQAGAIVGTPEYMSPEQAEGNIELDHRSDIYSLSVIMYESLTGRVPFHSGNPLSTLSQVINQRPASPYEVESGIPKWLGNLLLTCLEKKREDRVQTAGELAAYLSQRTYLPSRSGVQRSVSPTLKVTKESVEKSNSLNIPRGSISSYPTTGKRKPVITRTNTFILVVFVLVSIALGWLVLSKRNASIELARQEETARQLNQKAVQLMLEGDNRLEQKRFDEAIDFYQQAKGHVNDPKYDNRIALAREAKRNSETQKQLTSLEENSSSSATTTQPITQPIVKTEPTYVATQPIEKEEPVYVATQPIEKEEPVYVAPVTTALDYGYGTADARTVTVGTQEWLGKNLNVDRFANGDPIPEAKTDEEWKRAGENKQPAWCYYDNNPANGRTYGRLYNWYSVNDPRGLAPKGWHVPSKSEWTTIINYLGGETSAGLKMKSTSGWYQNGNGENNSGIAGLPGGGRHTDGFFYHIGKLGFWWSTYVGYGDAAVALELSRKNGKTFRTLYDKSQGFSVRCIKD